MALWPVWCAHCPRGSRPARLLRGPGDAGPELRRYAEEARHTQGLEVQLRVGLNSGDVVVPGPSATICTWTTRPWARPRTSQRAWSSSLPLGSIRLTAATLPHGRGTRARQCLWGEFPVKGLVDPVEVFELVGASTVRRRLQAIVALGLTRFVGRQTELVSLAAGAGARRDRARPGRGDCR